MFPSVGKRSAVMDLNTMERQDKLIPHQEKSVPTSTLTLCKTKISYSSPGQTQCWHQLQHCGRPR